METRRGRRCIQCGRAIQVEVHGYANFMAIMCSGCNSQLFSQQPNYPFVNNNSNFLPPPAPYGRRPSWRRILMGPQAPMTPPSPHGNKRAVLFGINYGKDSLNDVHSMKYLLTEKLGFPTDCIRMLTDEPGERNPTRIPTKYNMRMAMKWLVEGCQAGDSLVLHYSRHGSRQVDHGMDEAICPVDYEREGKIHDDEINATIVSPLPYGAKLHAVTDTCFSGTVLDLPFMCRMNSKGYCQWKDHRSHKAGYKGTRGGLAVFISAYDDDDDGSAADTSALSGMESACTLTYSFIQAMQEAMQVERKLTYGQLLNAMRSSIRGAREDMFGPNQQQDVMDDRQRCARDPQLSSSEKFNIYSEIIAI